MPLTSYEKINIILIKAEACGVKEQTIDLAKENLRKNPNTMLHTAYEQAFKTALKTK
jgi:hypothetical protein